MTLLELLQLLRKHLRLVIALPIACAVAMAAYAYLFMGNTYTASTNMYVLAMQGGESASNTLSTDLNDAGHDGGHGGGEKDVVPCASLLIPDSPCTRRTCG